MSFNWNVAVREDSGIFFIFLPAYVSELDNFAMFLHLIVIFWAKFYALMQYFCKVYIAKLSILQVFYIKIAKFWQNIWKCQKFVVSLQCQKNKK